jgi:GTPase Era involved in 16S rRNA processing
MNLPNKSSDLVKATITHFEDFFEIYDRLNPYLNIDETKKALIEKRRDWIIRLKDNEFPVAFLGSFSAGKSTIINGILGREVLPEATKSTTAFPTIIKKGSSDEAFVYYIDEDTKVSLWNQFSQKIGTEIGQDLQKQSQEKPGSHLNRIEKAIEEYEQISENKIDRTALGKLKNLLQGWFKDSYKQRKQINVLDLSQYIEGHEDSLYIDRIEVFLKNINIPNDVVIVDLPGLSVANQRHVDFTKQYIREKAKSFVVCMKPKSLLEGEEILFLNEISRSNPTILQRSFWAINQWDTLNEQQQKEEQENFDLKVKDYNFDINSDRCFKVSALNHLLLTCIAQGNIDEMPKLKNHLSNLEKSGLIQDAKNISSEQAKKLLDSPEVSSFSEFEKSLFSYLNKEAKEEFISDAKEELLRAIRILENSTKPLYDRYGQTTNIEQEIRAVEIDRQLDSFMKTIKAAVRLFAKEVRIAKESQFWKQSDTNSIVAEIDKRIFIVNRDELANSLMSGKDNQGMMSRLPHILEKEMGITALMRQKLTLVIDNSFIQRLAKLLTELEAVSNGFFPDEVMKSLGDKLGERDISMRLRGVADALFYKYGEEIDKVGSNLREYQTEPFYAWLDLVLKKYKTEVTKLVEELSKNLNYWIRLSIKNHAEDLEQELIELFDRSRSSIASQIARSINLDNTVADETKKQMVITQEHNKLNELKSSILKSLSIILNKENSKSDLIMVDEPSITIE